MKLKYIVQKNNTNISPRLHLFLPPPRRWTWVGRLREMYDSHFPVGLLLFSAFFSLPLLLFFSSSFFLFFFSIPTLLHGDFLHLLYFSSFLRLLAIILSWHIPVVLTTASDPLRQRQCNNRPRPPIRAPVFAAITPDLRCSQPRRCYRLKKRRKVPCARPETSIICEGTEKSIPLLPLVVDHNPRLSFSLLQASVDLLRVASPRSGIENSLYYI